MSLRDDFIMILDDENTNLGKSSTRGGSNDDDGGDDDDSSSSSDDDYKMTIPKNHFLLREIYDKIQNCYIIPWKNSNLILTGTTASFTLPLSVTTVTTALVTTEIIEMPLPLLLSSSF